MERADPSTPHLLCSAQDDGGKGGEAYSLCCHSERSEAESKNPFPFLRMEFGGRVKTLPYR